MAIRILHRFVGIALFFAVFAHTNAQSPAVDSTGSKDKTSSSQTQEKTLSKAKTQGEKAGPEIAGGHYEVTVTAARTLTPLREIGQSVTVITNADIETQGARTVLQVLETVPGFNVVRTGSFGGSTSVFVRGGESNFNLVLIDGVPINRGGGAFDFADLTTTNIDRIEIIRGPSSILYGANATTSVVNIITRKGQGKPSGSFGFEGGTYNSYLFRGALQGGSDKISYSFGGQYSESDGFYDFNNQYDRVDLSARMAIRLNSSSVVSTNVRYLDSQYHFPTDFIGAAIDPNDFRRTDELLYSVAYENSVNSYYSTKVLYGYYGRDWKSFTVEDGIVDFFNSTSDIVENRNYLDWQNEFQLNSNNLFTTGISYNREETEDATLARRSVGVYVQDQFSWADRFFLTAGVRYDHNDLFASFATVNVSIACLINDEWKLRTSLGNGFRAPSFIEIVGFPSFGILGNDALNPEKNFAADFGFDYFPRNRRTHLSATGFFNRFSDLIEFTFLAPPGTPNYINVERAKSQGLELHGLVAATEKLRFGGQYTLTDTKVTDSGTVPGGGFVEGEQLLRRPKHMAGVYAQFLKNRYKLRIDFKYKGKRDDVQFFPDFSSDRVVLPSYWKVDFGVTVPLFSESDTPGKVALVFRGQNLFNKRYTKIAGFESIGRSLFGGLEVGF